MSLEELRKKIDQIDERLIELMNERAQVVIEIGKAKSGGPVYAPDREKKVLARLTELNKGNLY